MKKDLDIYLESSFLVPLFIDNHIFNTQASVLFKKYIVSQWTLSYLTIDETIYILKKYGLSKKR